MSRGVLLVSVLLTIFFAIMPVPRIAAAAEHDLAPVDGIKRCDFVVLDETVSVGAANVSIERFRVFRIEGIAGDPHQFFEDLGPVKGAANRHDVLPVEGTLDRFSNRLNQDSPSATLLGLQTLDDIDGAIRLDPTSYLSFAVRADLLAKMERLKQAGTESFTAIRWEPGIGFSDRCARIVINRHLGKFDSAIRECEGLDERDPEAGLPFSTRGVRWQLKGNPTKELTDLDEAILIVGDGSSYYRRGIVELRHGEYPSALRDLREAAQRDAGFEPLVNAIEAWVLSTCPDAQLRDGRRALGLAQELIRLPDRGVREDDSILLAAAYAECGDFDSAVRWQEKAQLLNEENDGARGRWLETLLRIFASRRAYRDTEAALRFAGETTVQF